jgi:hypothetical protein
MKSALNVTETKVRTFQRKLEESIASLTDSETLLDRAIRIKEQQDKLLPLFQILSKEARGHACRLDLALASVIILSSGTFDQKLTQLLHAYDPDRSGQFDLRFLVAIQMLFHETFYVLNYLSFPPSRDEILNHTQRALLQLSSSSSSASASSVTNVILTQYELKQFLVTSLGMSKKLCGLVGILPTEKYSTYQRNRMSVLSLNRLNLISYSTTLYRAHYTLTTYRPLLAPEHMRQIHDLSLNMATLDPLRMNYDKFIKKAKQQSDSEVIPLDTGHLMSVKIYQKRTHNNSALKIQTMIRAYLQRRQAEEEAKRQAFRQAKKYAVVEMKEKVLKEFRRREGFEGTAKMKWDAQVRMRQAKLRSSGTNLSRADVVMVLMEEAIARATAEIEMKFAALEKEQGLEPERGSDDDVMEEKEGEGGGEDDTGEGIFKIFGLVKRQVMAENFIVKEELEVATPRLGDEEGEVESKSAGAVSPTDLVQEQQEKIAQLKTRSQLMLIGAYQYDPLAIGETINETIFRMEMSLPDPLRSHLWTRLQALDKNFTDVKLSDFLSELPSKRLLMRYLSQLTQQQLQDELQKHFRLVRHHEPLAVILMNLMKSDLVYGHQSHALDMMIGGIESYLRDYVMRRYASATSELEAMIEKRFQGADGRISELDLIVTELDRVRTHLSRYTSQGMDLVQMMSQLKQKYVTVTHSIHEMEKREFIIRNFLSQKLGHLTSQRIPIKERYRHDWMRRINAALQLSVSQGGGGVTDAEVQYNEIRSVCQDFLEFATSDALTIIREHRFDPSLQTIGLVVNEPVRGRPEVCGRGIHGRYYLYEAHGIQYFICLDYQGAFDGNDEYAMKAGGLERLGSLEYFKCQIPRLNIPLVATIDYFGYRVVAMSKLPLEQVSFTDEGEVKQVKGMGELLQYGLRDYGDRFVNKSKTLQSLFRQSSYRLNLSEHHCKGLQDRAGSVTFASSELKAYKGIDESEGGTGREGGGGGTGGGGSYYLKDFWRSFPSEDPSETPHLLQITHEQSLFWRQLRPEFVKRYKKALSPDALCATTYQQPDQPEHAQEIKTATRMIVQTLLPQYAESLCRREFTRPLADGYGIDFSMELHDLGINLRHLGYLRGLMWRRLPGFFNLFFNEHFVRTSLDLRGEVTNGMTLRVGDLQFTVTETNKRKISHNRLPIDKLYVGLSMRNQIASGGYLQAVGPSPLAPSAAVGTTPEANCDGLRSVLLTEMTCRTMKNLIRHSLRQYSLSENGISSDFQRQLICKFFNILTGSSSESNELLMNDIYHGIRSRYGSTAVMFSERPHLQHALLPCIPFAVRRLQRMLGVQISASSLTEFSEHCENFTFVPMDFISIQPLVQHNMPALAYSDAMLISMYATGEFTLPLITHSPSLPPSPSFIREREEHVSGSSPSRQACPLLPSKRTNRHKDRREQRHSWTRLSRQVQQWVSV